MPTFRWREAEILNECVGRPELMDALAVLALVIEGALGKLAATGLSATVLHCPFATARGCLAPDHEIRMFPHRRKVKRPRIVWQPMLVGCVFRKSRVIFGPHEIPGGVPPFSVTARQHAVCSIAFAE